MPVFVCGFTPPSLCIVFTTSRYRTIELETRCEMRVWGRQSLGTRCSETPSVRLPHLFLVLSAVEMVRCVGDRDLSLCPPNLSAQGERVLQALLLNNEEVAFAVPPPHSRSYNQALHLLYIVPDARNRVQCAKTAVVSSFHCSPPALRIEVLGVVISAKPFRSLKQKLSPFPSLFLSRFFLGNTGFTSFTIDARGRRV